MGAEHGGGRRRPVAGRRVGALVPGVRTRQVEVPRQADRLRGVLPRPERDGLRVLEGGARRARGERAAQVPDAVGVGHALQLGPPRTRGPRPKRGPRARRRRLAHGCPPEALPRLRSHPSQRPGLKPVAAYRMVAALRACRCLAAGPGTSASRQVGAWLNPSTDAYVIVGRRKTRGRRGSNISTLRDRVHPDSKQRVLWVLIARLIQGGLLVGTVDVLLLGA